MRFNYKIFIKMVIKNSLKKIDNKKMFYEFISKIRIQIINENSSST